MSMPLEPLSTAARTFVCTGRRALHTTQYTLVRPDRRIWHTILRMQHRKGIGHAKLTIG